MVIRKLWLEMTKLGDGKKRERRWRCLYGMYEGFAGDRGRLTTAEGMRVVWISKIAEGWLSGPGGTRDDQRRGCFPFFGDCHGSLGQSSFSISVRCVSIQFRLACVCLCSVLPLSLSRSDQIYIRYSSIHPSDTPTHFIYPLPPFLCLLFPLFSVSSPKAILLFRRLSLPFPSFPSTTARSRLSLRHQQLTRDGLNFTNSQSCPTGSPTTLPIAMSACTTHILHITHHPHHHHHMLPRHTKYT